MEDIYQQVLGFLYEKSNIPGYHCVKHIFASQKPPLTGRQIMDVVYSLKNSGFIFTDTSKYYGLASTIGGRPTHSIEEITIPAQITPEGIKHYRETYLNVKSNINVSNNMGNVSISGNVNQSFSDSDKVLINPLTQNITNKTAASKPKRVVFKSSLEVISWIVGIIGGLIIIYEFVKKFK